MTKRQTTEDVLLKRPRGRPVQKTMPELIPDTPENIARAIMSGPPKKDWDYLKKSEDDE